MLTVVIVTYRPPQGVLQACIASVVEAGGADHVVVVDDGGGDPPPGVDDAGDVVWLRTPVNSGFGAAANVGFRWAEEHGAEMIALLNDDVTVAPGWLAPLQHAIATVPRCGAAQPKLVYAGAPPRVNSLGVEIGPDGSGVDIGYGRVDDPSDDGDREIAAFTGGAVLFSAAFLGDLGGFDERMFLYYEDVDLARRGAQRGWVYRCVPSSVVAHLGSATTGALGDRVVMLRERNRILNAVRHESAATVGRAWWLGIRKLRHAPRRAHLSALVQAAVATPRRLWERRRARRVRRASF